MFLPDGSQVTVSFHVPSAWQIIVADPFKLKPVSQVTVSSVLYVYVVVLPVPLAGTGSPQSEIPEKYQIQIFNCIFDLLLK